MAQETKQGGEAAPETMAARVARIENTIRGLEEAIDKASSSRPDLEMKLADLTEQLAKLKEKAKPIETTPAPPARQPATEGGLIDALAGGPVLRGLGYL